MVQTILQKKKQLMQKLRLKFELASDFITMDSAHRQAIQLNKEISHLLEKEKQI